MPVIVIGVQILTGGRDRGVPEVIAHVSQIDLPIHHV